MLFPVRISRAHERRGIFQRVLARCLRRTAWPLVNVCLERKSDPTADRIAAGFKEMGWPVRLLDSPGGERNAIVLAGKVRNLRRPKFLNSLFAQAGCYRTWAGAGSSPFPPERWRCAPHPGYPKGAQANPFLESRSKFYSAVGSDFRSRQTLTRATPSFRRQRQPVEKCRAFHVRGIFSPEKASIIRHHSARVPCMNASPSPT